VKSASKVGVGSRGARWGWAFGSVLLVLAALAGGGCARPSFGPRDSADAFSAYLDERVPRLLERYGVAGVSMALVRGGKPVWSGAYGFADREQGRRMTVDSVCRVESISKSVTAWGVMRLVEQGRIGLDDPVQRHLVDWELPESEYSWQEVTVRRLLSGSAGMTLGSYGGEYAPQGEIPSLRAYLVQEVRLVREPGTGFLYSNVGFNLLELLVEEATGRAFDRYMAEEVLIPLGMSRSSFAWDEAMTALMPVGYELQGAPVPPYVYPAKASGGLFATVEDVARFVSAGMTGAYYSDRGVLEEQSIRRIHTPEVRISGIFAAVTDMYGFGHFIENLPDGRQAVWHGGQGHGWMTHFHAVPESGDGIVILTNSQRSWPFMARVLNDWARWSGLGSVKMGRITWLTAALWVLIGLAALLSLGQAVRLVQGLRTGSRRWAPLAGETRGVRLLLAAAGIGVIAALVWSVAQPYLFVSSIFPSAVRWAGLSLLCLAILMVLTALFPRGTASR